MRLILLLLALAIVSSAKAAEYRTELVADDLEYPWCLAFLPDGSMLVTERIGQLRRISRDGAVSAPLAGVPPVYARSQGGLFDVLPDPDFATNRTIFLSFAHGDPDNNATRIVSAALGDDGLSELRTLFTARPMKSTPVHYGGRMSFGPRGDLYMGLGDGFDWREQAQVLSNHFGTVIRLHRDGSVPQDNPFVGRADALPEIFSYGHRNPQGLVYDARNQRLFLHEHGAKGGDELNLLQPGANYGWPITTHGVDYTGAVISPHTDLPGIAPPLTHWTPSIAPAGMALYQGELFPAWQGDLFIAALKERSVRRLTLNGTQVANQEILFRELKARIRDVRSGPDGALYLLTDSSQGQIIRVLPDTPDAG